MAGKKVGVHGNDSETGRNKGEKKCPITRAQFDEAPATVELPAQILQKKVFATGTLGYFGQVSFMVNVPGVGPVKLTGNVQGYVPHSKEAE